MQVVKLDMTNSSYQCPPGTRLRNYDQLKRLCGADRDDPGCNSTMFDALGIRYNQICGKIIGYQFSSPDTFGVLLHTDGSGYRDSSSIDGNYVDGISLTHRSNPRKHIWTFAGGLDEAVSFSFLNCPCTNTYHAETASQPPSFVGNDYFCDTGSERNWYPGLYGDDPLWDGAGCGVNNTCCSLSNPPWFLKQLPSSTTNDIEMRMCTNQGYMDEDTPIEIIEHYVH